MATVQSLIARLNAIKNIDKASIIDDKGHQKVVEFAKKQFTSNGGYGGRPWAFYGSEPKYLTYKLAMGARPIPLRWVAGMERVYPALTNPNDSNHRWSRRGNNVFLDITIPYLARIEKGGVNQFGEPAPGRQIFPNGNKRLSKDVMEAVKQEFYRRVSKT